MENFLEVCPKCNRNVTEYFQVQKLFLPKVTLMSLTFQGFVFCALLEFALVNYASRSDIQRERSRERIERARRQWELENADSLDPSANSLPRQNKVPSYEATVLHMVSKILLITLHQ